MEGRLPPDRSCRATGRSSVRGSDPEVVVGTARVVLHIPGAQSLKDKRQVVKSLIAQVQREYRVSAAEVERQDQWQVAVIGLAYVSTSAAHADEVVARAVRYLSERRGDAELLEFETESIHAF